jgi:hypothetical protein
MYYDIPGGKLARSVESYIAELNEDIMWSDALSEWIERNGEKRELHRIETGAITTFSYRMPKHYLGKAFTMSKEKRKEITDQIDQLHIHLMFMDVKKTYRVHFTQLTKFGLHKSKTNILYNKERLK